MVEENETGVFDKNSFSVIIRNLLHNAIKFSHSKSEIKVKIVEKDGKKGVKIIDSGIGMSPEIIEQVQKGLVGKSRKGTGYETGTGLGLSTCLSLAKKNASSIQILSKEGEGSEFTLFLN